MHLARVPPQESPPSGAAGRLTRRDHHLAPRPALVRAHRRGDEPCGRSVIARPHGVRLGGTIRVNIDRVVPRGEAAAVLRTSGTPRVDSTTAGHRCGQRGVIMRGRRGSRFRPSARATGVARRVRRSRVETDAHTDDALLALVRLLARQAAREAFAQAAAESDRSIEEDRE